MADDVDPGVVIEFDEAEYQRVAKLLEGVPNGAKIALSTAINKTLRSERTALARKMAAEVGAKKQGIDKRLTVRKATREHLSGSLRLNGKTGVSLIAFFARQTKKGVKVKIAGEELTYPHAFISKGVGGGRQVFERTEYWRAMTKGHFAGMLYKRGIRKGRPFLRQAIASVKGPTVASIYENTPGMKTGAITNVNANFAKNVKSQIEWLLARGTQPNPRWLEK